MHSRRSYSQWRLLIVAPRSGAENMARDTALQARAARTGETVSASFLEPSNALVRPEPAGIGTLRRREDSRRWTSMSYAGPPEAARFCITARSPIASPAPVPGRRASSRDVFAASTEFCKMGWASSAFPSRSRPFAASTRAERACLLRDSGSGRARGGWQQARWQRTVAGRRCAVAARLHLVDDDQSSLPGLAIAARKRLRRSRHPPRFTLFSVERRTSRKSRTRCSARCALSKMRTRAS